MKRNRLLPFLLPLLILAGVALVYQYGYLQMNEEVASLKQEQDLRQRHLTKQVRMLSEKSSLEAGRAALTERRKAENVKIYEGQTPQIVAAAIQEAVKGIITEKGGTVSSGRQAGVETTGSFTTVTVAVDAILPDVTALSDLLYAVEHHTPALVVRDLDVRVRNLRVPKDLSVKITLAGLTAAR